MKHGEREMICAADIFGITACIEMVYDQDIADDFNNKFINMFVKNELPNSVMANELIMMTSKLNEDQLRIEAENN